MKTRTVTEETWEQVQNKLNELIINNDNLNKVILQKSQENESLQQTIDKLYDANKQLQKLNKLVQKNYMIEINKLKKLYDEEILYSDSLKIELQDCNKEKEMWKQRYFELEKELQPISNMESDVLKYLPIQQQFDDKLRKYEEQIEALNEVLQNKEQDLQNLKEQFDQKQIADSQRNYNNAQNDEHDLEDLKKHNNDLLCQQLEQKNKIAQLEKVIQSLNVQIQKQVQNQRTQQSASQQLISSSEPIRSDQLIDEGRNQQNNETSFENRRKKTSFYTEPDYSIDNNMTSQRSINRYSLRSNNDINKIGQQEQLQSYSPLALDKKQSDQAGVLDDLDKQIDYLMRKQSRKMSQAYTEFGSQQNIVQDSVRGDFGKSSNNTSFSKPSGSNQGIRKEFQQPDDVEDQFLFRQNTQSFQSSQRSININNKQFEDDDDKFMKNYNMNDYNSKQANANKVPGYQQSSFSHQSFSFQNENPNIINNSNQGDNNIPQNNSSQPSSKYQEINRVVDENNKKYTNQIESYKNENQDQSKEILDIQSENPKPYINQIENNTNQNHRRLSRQQQQQQLFQEDLNQKNKNQQNQNNAQQNEQNIEQIYKQQSGLINSSEIMNQADLPFDIQQRLRLTSEELMQQRYQQQQLDGPSPVKKNSRNFKVKQKKRLSFQKELEINIYQSQNNSEVEEDDENDDDDDYDNLDDRVEEELQLSAIDQNQQQRNESDLNLFINDYQQKMLSQQINQKDKQSMPLQSSSSYENIGANEQKLQKLQEKDYVGFDQQQRNNQNNSQQLQYYKQQFNDEANLNNLQNEITRQKKSSEILDSKIYDEKEKQLALQIRFSALEQEKISMMLSFKQKLDEVEDAYKKEIIILEQKIETHENNQNQMQNLVVQFQLQNQLQKEKEIDLYSDIESKKMVIEQLQEKINISNENLERLKIIQQQMKELDYQFKEKIQIISDQDNQITQLYRENTRLNDELQNQQHQIKVGKLEKDQFKQKDSELLEAKLHQEKIKNEYEQKIHSMQKTIDNLNNQIKDDQLIYQRNIQQLKKKQQEEFNDMRVEADTQMIKLQTAQEQMQVQLKEQYQQNTDLQDECQILKNQNDELSTLLRQNQTQFMIEIEKLNLQSSEKFEKQILSQKSQLTQDLLELERKNIELKSQIDIGKVETRKLFDRLEDQELLLKEQKNKIEQKEQQLMIQGQSFDENILNLEKKFYDLNKINEDLKQAMILKDQEIKRLFLSREEEQENQQELEQQCKSLEEIFSQFKEEKLQYEKKIMDLVDKIFDLQQQLSVVTKEKKEWQKLNENKTKQIEEYQRKLVHLNIDFNSAQLEISLSPQKKIVDSALQEGNQKPKLIQLDVSLSQSLTKQQNMKELQKNGLISSQRMNNSYNIYQNNMLRTEEDYSNYHQ